MSEEQLAYALCTSSWHISLYPRKTERPCAYHRQRAADALKVMAHEQEGKWLK